MREVAGEGFESQPPPDRIILDAVEQVVRRHLIDVHTEETCVRPSLTAPLAS